MKAAVIVDSTAYLPESLRQLPNVFQVDLTVIFEDGTVAEDTVKEEEQVKFFERLSKEKVLPTTSQPTIGQYYETLDAIVAAGYDTVYAIHLSKAISGTYQSALMVLDEYVDRLRTYPIDSRMASVVCEAIVENILNGIDQGKDSDKIYEDALWQTQHSQIYLMVENLDNLAKGGRLSTTGAVIGNLLKIRPLLYFHEGRIELFERIRTNKRVYQRFYELIQEAMATYPQGIEVRFAHVLAPQEVAYIQKEISHRFSGVTVKVNGLGPVVAAHTGLGAIGMAIIPSIKA